jgi:hypothetical protein
VSDTNLKKNMEGLARIRQRCVDLFNNRAYLRETRRRGGHNSSNLRIDFGMSERGTKGNPQISYVWSLAQLSKVLRVGRRQAIAIPRVRFGNGVKQCRNIFDRTTYWTVVPECPYGTRWVSWNSPPSSRGAERTRTVCQARSRYRTGLWRVIHRGNSAI